MHTLTFIGTGTLARLPEAMSGAGVRIRAVGNPDNPLARSRFVDEYLSLDYASAADLSAALLARPDLLDALDGWVIYGEDHTPREIARSDLPVATKARLLPARSQTGLEMLGSKVGLAALQAATRRGGPSSTVAHGSADLAKVLHAVERPCLIKSDRGAGGEEVLLHRPGDTGTLAQVPRAWYPVVVQDYIAGIDVSIEVLMRDGTLAAWTYSVATSMSGSFGPTLSRRYVNPPRLDFVDDLEDLGRLGGLHGFFNCSLRWSPSEARHYLFELDPRPNAWHQFGPCLGVDWVAAMTQPHVVACRRPRLPEGGVAICLYPRQLLWGINNRKWQAVRPWLLGEPGTWEARNRRDHSVNRSDRQALLRASGLQARITIAQALGRGWQVLPAPFRDQAERRGLKNTVGRALGTS